MKTMFTVIYTALLSMLVYSGRSQKSVYSHADSLKGTYGPARSWWNVLHYDLHVSFNIGDSSLAGYNEITYKVLQPSAELQLDLMSPLEMDSIVQYGEKLSWRRDGNAFFVTLPVPQHKGQVNKLRAYYHGRPVQAKNPPWDGGVIWSRDDAGNAWISVACQGMAAQVWYPNKDHMADEPDSATMHFTVPQGLFVVSNGRFKGIMAESNGEFTYSWKVRNPINNYNIIPYIGKYMVLKDTFQGKAGILDLEFWCLQESHLAARRQFEQVKPMLRCFEEWFGPYPFYRDGYKLVEAPFLGMEHQSAIAYGNGFINGYMGRDLSGTGWGLKWDFIIVHESGHEWFGNNISAADVADNWIHESFTAYAENLFTECLYGREAGAAYVRGTRTAIMNDAPVIGDHGVNAGGSLDLYYKGANMLHTIRQIVNNDSLWKNTLRSLNTNFRHQTINSAMIEAHMSSFLSTDLQKVFDQYLRTVDIPVFEYRQKKNKLRYRWSNVVKGFDMPLRVKRGEEIIWLRPTAKWRKVKWSKTPLIPDPDFYIETKAR